MVGFTSGYRRRSGFLFKLLIVVGWGVFALDAFLVIVATVSRNMGDDAAGRGALA